MTRNAACGAASQAAGSRLISTLSPLMPSSEMSLRTPEVGEFEVNLFFVVQALCLPGRDDTSRPSSGITASAGNAEMNLGAADTNVCATSNEHKAGVKYA